MGKKYLRLKNILGGNRIHKTLETWDLQKIAESQLHKLSDAACLALAFGPPDWPAKSFLIVRYIYYPKALYGTISGWGGGNCHECTFNHEKEHQISNLKRPSVLCFILDSCYSGPLPIFQSSTLKLFPLQEAFTFLNLGLTEVKLWK